MWHVALAMAGQPPHQDDWLELVLRASGEDGATAAVDELADEAERLCAAGVVGACSFRDWGADFRPSDAWLALDPQCVAGDPVSCLVSAWALGQEPWGTWAQRAQSAVDARLHAERACALGLPRGCVEVARALFAGVASTARPNKARERLDVLCKAKEASACGFLGVITPNPRKRRDLLARAADLGFVPALRSLAQVPGVDPLVFHEAACTAGMGASCRDLAALDLARMRPSLEEGCRVRHGPACNDLAVLHFVDGDEEGALAVLDGLCSRSEDACARAELLRHGRPPRPVMMGALQQDDQLLLEAEIDDAVWHCYRSRLARGDVIGNVSVYVQVSPEGVVEGTAVLGDLADDEFQGCVDDASRLVVPTESTTGGPALVRFERFMGHAAEVRFRPDPKNDAADEVALTDELTMLAPPLETCALLDPVEVAPIAVEISVRRSGRIVVREVARSSESAAVDACVTDVLRSTRLSSEKYQHDGLVLVRFLEALRNGGPEEG